jgi:hypothetical protein
MIAIRPYKGVVSCEAPIHSSAIPGAPRIHTRVETSVEAIGVMIRIIRLPLHFIGQYRVHLPAHNPNRREYISLVMLNLYLFFDNPCADPVKAPCTPYTLYIISGQ